MQPLKYTCMRQDDDLIVRLSNKIEGLVIKPKTLSQCRNVVFLLETVSIRAVIVKLSLTCQR